MSKNPLTLDFEFVPVEDVILNHLAKQFEDGNKLKDFILRKLRELKPIYDTMGATEFEIDLSKYKNARINIFDNNWINSIAEYCIGYGKCEIRCEELIKDFMKYKITILKYRG